MDPPLHSGVKSAVGESQPKRLKTQTSTGKVLASVFWDAQAILFIDYLGKRRTINSKYYIALLVHLKEEIAKKRPQMKKKKELFHQDNASCHKLIATMAKLHELHFKWLLHTPYSPDLAPSIKTVCSILEKLPGNLFSVHFVKVLEVHPCYSTTQPQLGRSLILFNQRD